MQESLHLPVGRGRRLLLCLGSRLAMLLCVIAVYSLNPPVALGGACFGCYSVTYILSIGVNEYRSTRFPHLHYAEADASELPLPLAHWVNSASIPGEVVISTLLGRNATVGAIRLEMQNIASKARPRDSFFFIFDGMGVCLQTNSTYQFAAFDSDVEPDSSISNGLRAKELGALLVQIPASRQFVIVDACGSHKAVDDLRSALQPPGQDQNLLQREVQLLAPDGASQESDRVGHGLLTAALLEGLRGGADTDKSGRITWDRLVGYVTWRLPETAQGEHLYAQTIYSDSVAASSPTRGGKRPEKEDPELGPDDVGHDFALLVGTDHYSEGWPTLHNPVFDVTALRGELVHDFGFTDDPDHIIELHDALKRDVEHAVEALLKKQFGPRDRLLVYFAGHGMRTPIEGYLVFAKSKAADAEDATDSMMAFSLLSNALDKVQVPHLLLVMDVCYGGLFDGRTRNGATRFQSLLGSNTDGTVSRNTLIQRALEKPSRIYITSGDEDHQVSDGAPGQHSPFSKRFLAVLQQNRTVPLFLDVATLYNGLRSIPREPKAGYFYSGLAEQGADYLFIPRPQPTVKSQLSLESESAGPHESGGLPD